MALTGFSLNRWRSCPMLVLLLQPQMKTIYLLAVLLVAFLAISCQHKSAPARPAAAPAKVIVTAEMSAGAKVVSVNAVGRFVVLSFPNGDLPKVQHPMFLYRAGLKVAAIKITGPQQGNNIVADLVSGEAKTGDTASEQ